MPQNHLSLSLVIPVYNEAAYLGRCLQAIAQQTLRPLEVIVVDNNSTDGSVAVARSFSFVTVLQEPRQGVVHARNRGFDAARSDIIGRIDADTILPLDWVARVLGIFADRTVSAVSGAPHYYDFPLAALADGIDLPLRARLARKLQDTNFLWGANMALRRTAWQQVRQHLCAENELHEDFDLAIHLQQLGLTVAYDEQLVASVSSRRVDVGLLAFIRYTLVSPKTYAAHDLRSRRHMYPALAVCWAFYLPARIIYRGYNQETGSFSFTHLLETSASRVDPTTNVA